MRMTVWDPGIAVNPAGELHTARTYGLPEGSSWTEARRDSQMPECRYFYCLESQQVIVLEPLLSEIILLVEELRS